MPSPSPHVLPHAVFLQRVSDHPPTAPEVRLGQGAFLALRLLDLLAPEREPVAVDAFRYQSAATERYCDELVTEGAEAAHLLGLARIAVEAQRRGDVRLIAPAMLAYALFLEEDEGQYAEAEDVLESLLHVVSHRLAIPDALAALLRLARVNRKMARFDEAEITYQQAGELARAAGDGYSALLSRLGLANCVWGRGNLAEAEREYLGILRDAHQQGQRDPEARAEHGLGAVLASRSRGEPHLAVKHLWRAFELYEDEASRVRVLNDLAFALMTLGQYVAAERALTIVVRRGGGTNETLVNAFVELMNCASARRDRIGFERWRNECQARLHQMTPNSLADFYYKSGIGLARFGSYGQARGLIDKAVA
ncbi:MAG: hypothetical protein HY560_04895, partial [Gemmatimonadetes bacterium]|nr:hypothetical protein [Gemmatimonadota bacterium]